MARDDKSAAVAEITEEFRSSSAAVLTEYRGLTVSQITALRRSLAGVASYSVVKNTLTRIAAREAGVEGLDHLLVGPSAIAFVKGDPVEAAKGLRAFAKEHPALVLKGGYMEGRVLDAAEVAKLADLESREVLLSKLAGAMKASMSQAAALFVAPLAQAARTIEALRVKAEADPSIIGGPGEAGSIEQAVESAAHAVGEVVENVVHAVETAVESVVHAVEHAFQGESTEGEPTEGESTEPVAEENPVSDDENPVNADESPSKNESEG